MREAVLGFRLDHLLDVDAQTVDAVNLCVRLVLIEFYLFELNSYTLVISTWSVL